MLFTVHVDGRTASVLGIGAGQTKGCDAIAAGVRKTRGLPSGRLVPPLINRGSKCLPLPGDIQDPGGVREFGHKSPPLGRTLGAGW